MSVHQFMLGRELPCNVMDLLGINPLPLPGQSHAQLVEQVEGGKAFADLLYRLGLSHLGRQELGLAMQRLQAAVQLKGEYAPARLALAAVLDLLARHSDAADQLDAVLATLPPETEISTSSSPSRYTLLCAIGLCQERLGNVGSAVYTYEQALANNPVDLFARYRLAAINVAHDQLDDAVEHYRAILTAEPQEAAVRTSLAHILQLLGRHKEAAWEYQKALCLAPDCWELQLELAGQYERLGDSAQAIAQLRQLTQRNPHYPDLHLRLANLYSDNGDDSHAFEEYTAALALHPDYLDGHIALARHELKMGRTQAALEHFHRAVTINQQNVEAYAGLAVALHRLGKLEEARETMASAWKIAGNTDVLVAQMGLLELQAEAAASAAEVLDAQPEIPASEPRLSRESAADAAPAATDPAEMQRSWLANQVQRYEQVLTEHPGWADVHVRYGMLLKLLGRVDDALAAFTKATQLNPGYTEAWVQLGLLQEQRGESPAAIAALEKALQIQPQYADLHYRLALIYCNALEFDLAMERMEDAVALNKDNPDFQRQLWVALQGLQLAGRQKQQQQSAPPQKISA